MRIILDTNVIIAAFATRGLCHSIFELCIDRYTIIISDEILMEINANLKKKLNLPHTIVSEILTYLQEVAYKEDVDEKIKGICRDPDDDKILGLAKESNANYIVTGDEDLLPLKEFGVAKIVTPREFYEIVKQQKES